MIAITNEDQTTKTPEAESSRMRGDHTPGRKGTREGKQALVNLGVLWQCGLPRYVFFRWTQVQEETVSCFSTRLSRDNVLEIFLCIISDSESPEFYGFRNV